MRNLEQQTKDWEELKKLTEIISMIPNELPEIKTLQKQKLWEEVKKYYDKYKIKFDYFHSPK